MCTWDGCRQFAINFETFGAEQLLMSLIRSEKPWIKKVGKGPWKLHWDDKTGTFDKVIVIVAICFYLSENFFSEKTVFFAGQIDVNSWQKTCQAWGGASPTQVSYCFPNNLRSLIVSTNIFSHQPAIIQVSNSTDIQFHVSWFISSLIWLVPGGSWPKAESCRWSWKAWSLHDFSGGNDLWSLHDDGLDNLIFTWWLSWIKYAIS